MKSGSQFFNDMLITHRLLDFEVGQSFILAHPSKGFLRFELMSVTKPGECESGPSIIIYDEVPPPRR
jgi:hypothetical protein